MIRRCIARRCGNKSGVKAASMGLHFHKLPSKNPGLLKKWLEKLNRKDPPRQKSASVCSEHFTPDCYVKSYESEMLGTSPRHVLKDDAIPTIFDSFLTSGSSSTISNTGGSSTPVQPAENASICYEKSHCFFDNTHQVGYFVYSETAYI